jgi:hypothetical protein
MNMFPFLENYSKAEVFCIWNTSYTNTLVFMIQITSHKYTVHIGIHEMFPAVQDFSISHIAQNGTNPTGTGVKLTTHLHLLPTLGTRGVIPPLSHTSACRGA